MKSEAAYLQQAALLLQAVGGALNIRSFRHCTTRLRLHLQDQSLLDEAQLAALPELVDYLLNGKSLQVVVQNDVAELYKALESLIGVLDSDTVTANMVPRQVKLRQHTFKFFSVITATLSGTIMPIVGFLAAAGTINAVFSLLFSLNLIGADSGIFRFFGLIYASLMSFLPVLLGYTSARYFKLNSLVGIALGICLLPNFQESLSAALNFRQFMPTELLEPLSATFPGIFSYSGNSGNIFPVIFAALINIKLEAWCKRIFPASVLYLMVPLVCLALSVPILLLCLCPLGNLLSFALAQGLYLLVDDYPILTGFSVGLCWEILVSVGLHWLVTPAMVNNLSTLGYDPVAPMIMSATFAVMGVMLGYCCSRGRSVSAELKNAAAMTIIGITEPALYGFLLKNRTLFISTVLIGGCGAAFISLCEVRFYTLTNTSVLSFPLAVAPDGSLKQAAMLILCCSLVFAAAFSAGLLFNRRWPCRTKKAAAAPSAPESVEIAAPTAGKVVPLTAVNDPIFKSLMLGDGFAIDPLNGEVRAPAAGQFSAEISFAHALGLTTVNGAELLIHAGINTVRLEGEGFKLQVKPGAEVKAGELLLTFDLELLKQRGFDPVVLVVVTNQERFKLQHLESRENVAAGAPLLRLTPAATASKN